MTFQLKDFPSITAAMINVARGSTTKLTDFAPGSAARTLMEAPAVEMEELYLQMFLGLRDAIPVAVFRSFDFDRLPAAYARGYATVRAATVPTADMIIPAGTQFVATDGRVYASTSYVTWLAGQQTVRVQVQAPEIGSVGNIPEGFLVSSPLFAESAYTIGNTAITSGRDVEQNEERETRFAAFVASLSRGTTVAELYAVSLAVVTNSAGEVLEYVDRSGLVEEPGHVQIFVRGSGGAPSADLLAAGQALIDGSYESPGYRAAGVRVDVLAMEERAVSGAFEVRMLSGYDLDADTIAALGDVYGTQIAAVAPGATLYLGDLVDALLAVDGVAKIVPATTENITCAQGEALVPGAVTFTALT